MKPKPLSEPKEGEVESSEDELPPEEELTNVLFSEIKNNFSNLLPGPSSARSDQTEIPGPSTENKPREEKQTKKKPSPIKYPGANERTYSGDDIPLNKLTTPKRPRSHSNPALPKCGTEHRHRPFIASSEHARYEVSPSNNWFNSQWQQADSMEEEEEGENLSEDDISTDKCDKNYSSEEEGA